MRFKIEHLVFKNVLQTFNEINAPEWMTHRDNHWWWEGYVLTLAIGDSIESDFHSVTRLS